MATKMATKMAAGILTNTLECTTLVTFPTNENMSFLIDQIMKQYNMETYLKRHNNIKMVSNKS